MKHIKCLISCAAAAVMTAQLLPCMAAEETTHILTVPEPGYYDITASYSNTSVDGSCYMWAKSAASTEGTAVLPVSTATSGDKIVVKGVYADDGKIEYGLYNDGVSEASISDVQAVKSEEYTFLNGGDISEYTIVQDNGGKYYSMEGKEVNPLAYLADNGMNICRIRLSNDPGPGHGDGTYYLAAGYQDEADCLNLAKQAKAAGMQIVFTFNYSDYWSNGERQRIPAEWVQEIKDSLGYDVESYDFLKSMTAEQRTEIKNKLSTLIYNYTEKVMKDLKAQGTMPEYVSIGNEINGGVFIPFGGSYNSYFNPSTYSIEYEQTDNNVRYEKDFEGIAQLLNSGYDAIKAVSPDTQVIVHLASDGRFNKENYNNWWYDAYRAAGGKWDVTGISYYPSWTTQTAEVCKTRVNELSASYDKPVMIMEAGFNWNDKKKDGYDGQLFNIDAYKEIYSDTQSGHKGFMTELINYMKQADHCLGILYWDPLKIHVEDQNGNNLVGWAYMESDNSVQSNVVENTTLFDFDGKAIATTALYRDSKNAARIGVKLENVYLDAEKNICADINCAYDKNADLIAAVYDKNGQLTEVYKTTAARQGSTQLRFAADAEKAEAVKVFMRTDTTGFTASERRAISK